MLRSVAETALDEVVEACRAAADHFASVARVAGAGDLASLFIRLEEEHAALAAALEEEIRREGKLPSAPDADREAVEHLVTRVRAAFSGDEWEVLIEESLRVEADLSACIEEALRHEQPPGTRAFLKRLHDLTASARERLTAAQNP